MNGKKTLIIPALISVVLLAFSGCTGKTYVTQKSSVSMGSVVTVKTYGSGEETNSSAQDSALAEVSALDTLISKNSEGAALYVLNETSGNETVIDPQLYSYLKQTADIYSVSGKKASVTSGALTNAWGFDTDEFRLPSSSEISDLILLCDDSLVSFNDDRCSVKTAKGQLFNLGSVGKGLACDKAAASIKKDGTITGAVVSVGGSIATVGLPNGKDSWSVGIRNPYGSENEYFATLSLGETFISTSGSYEKTFVADGVTYHHLLDLTTGYPADNGLCSVTIVAPSGLVSDALSTMCFLLGEEKSADILSKYNAEAVYVYNDRTVSATDGIKASVKITDSSFTLI